MKNRRGLLQGFVIGLVLLAVAITSYGVQQGLAQDAKAQATIEKACLLYTSCSTWKKRRRS